MWRRGRVGELPVGPFDRGDSRALDDRGWVVGWTFDAEQDERATLWRRGRATDLVDVGGGASSAVAVNNRGEVLVTSQTGEGEHPALWRGGVLHDLTEDGLPADGAYADLDDRTSVVGAIRPPEEVVCATVWRR